MRDWVTCVESCVIIFYFKFLGPTSNIPSFKKINEIKIRK